MLAPAVYRHPLSVYCLSMFFDCVVEFFHFTRQPGVLVDQAVIVPKRCANQCRDCETK